MISILSMQIGTLLLAGCMSLALFLVLLILFILYISLIANFKERMNQQAENAKRNWEVQAGGAK